MQKYQIRFPSRTVTVEGNGPTFVSKFVAAIQLAKARGEALPTELQDMSLLEIRAFAKAVPDSAGAASPVVSEAYGQVDQSYEEEVAASTAVSKKASGSH